MHFGLGAYSLRYSSLDESDFRKMSLHIPTLPVVSMGRRKWLAVYLLEPQTPKSFGGVDFKRAATLSSSD
jgi:hypothetical protein